MEIFRSRSTTTRGGTLKNFIFHYHAPQDLEKFRTRSTTTRGGTLKNFIFHYHAPRDFWLSLHYHARRDFEILSLASLRRVTGLLLSLFLSP